MNHPGHTRTCLRRDHALIAPDSHVDSPLARWTGCRGIVLISPVLGARFTQYLALMEPGGIAGPPMGGAERFFYVLEGEVHLEAESEDFALAPGGYAYVPPGLPHRLGALTAARLCVFERLFRAVPRLDVPTLVVRRAQDIPGEPFLGDPDARLQVLLPDDPSFDMAVNLFTFQPGAALPFVECHVMEHGLLMVAGQGVYRLSDRWYPVAEGDVIWMASYCPQWFACHGKQPASYLYYKDVHRDPLYPGG